MYTCPYPYGSPATELRPWVDGPFYTPSPDSVSWHQARAPVSEDSEAVPLLLHRCTASRREAATSTATWHEMATRPPHCVPRGPSSALLPGGAAGEGPFTLLVNSGRRRLPRADKASLAEATFRFLLPRCPGKTFSKMNRSPPNLRAT